MKKFLDTLDKIGRLDKKLQEQLASVQWFCENGSIYEVYLHSLNLEETAERLVLLTRVLPAYTGVRNAKLEVEHRIKDYSRRNWFYRGALVLPSHPSIAPKEGGRVSGLYPLFLISCHASLF